VGVLTTTPASRTSEVVGVAPFTTYTSDITTAGDSLLMDPLTTPPLVRARAIWQEQLRNMGVDHVQIKDCSPMNLLIAVKHIIQMITAYPRACV
jgi:hypothetical protein